jgi:hypothetical protein
VATKAKRLTSRGGRSNSTFANVRLRLLFQ